MPDHPQDVKDNRRRIVERVGYWIDCHPRTGWWIAVLMLINTVLNILDLFVK